MGSIERKARLKEETRINILNAALKIVKEDGWASLSMRKIADMIEYTVPVIYEYFNSKEAILLEMTRIGFVRLNLSITKAIELNSEPSAQLENMWLAYWDFAFQEKEFYQLMFGVGTHCCESGILIPESHGFALSIQTVIRKLLPNSELNARLVSEKYFMYWSLVHGLIALNLIEKGGTNTFNKHILLEAISGVTASLIV